MSKVGEFELIRRIAAAFRHPERSASCHPESCPELAEGRSEGYPGVVGIGDDCAVLPQRDGVDTLVTTDLLIEDRHFLLADISPEDLGWKSAAVNISDIAAMGGRPTASFLSIALPKTLRARDSAVPSKESPFFMDGGVKIDVPSKESPFFMDGGVKIDVPSKESPLFMDGGVKNGAPYTPTAVFLDGGVKNGAPYTPTAVFLDGGTEESRTEGGERADSAAEWVERFIAGFRKLSDRFGVPLLGGDTSASPDKLFINVTVLGECPHGQAIMRSGARPGDLICVTGTLGDAAAGFRLILERATDDQDSPALSQQQVDTVPAAPPPDCRGAVMTDTIGHLIERHYRPMPRVIEGQALAAIPGVHAMMDISDGIASDLRHILEESGKALGKSSLAAEVDVNALPLSEELRGICAERGWDPVELAVSGGEDYELLFTVAPEALPAARRALASAVAVPSPDPAVSGSRSGDCDPRVADSAVPGSHETDYDPLTVIGRVTEGGGIRWIGGERDDYQGFTHF